MSLVASFSLVAQKKDLVKVRQFAEDTGQKLDLDSETTAQMRLVVDEAATNVLEHGYQGRPGWLELTVRQERSDLIVELSDEAPSFNPLQVSPPDLSVPALLRSPGGMGLHLMRQALDELSYEAPPTGGNRLIMVWRDVFRRA